MRQILLILPFLLLSSACSSSETSDKAFDRGTESWEAGKDEEAIRIYTRTLKHDPKHLPTRLNLARIYYERGEQPHLEQRRLIRQADQAEDRKDREAAALLDSQAESKKQQCSAHYRAANEHLDYLLANDPPPEITAHGAYLRFRTAIFFEDWKVARQSLRRAIDTGNLQGTRKAKYENFLRKLDEETPKPLLEGNTKSL